MTNLKQSLVEHMLSLNDEKRSIKAREDSQ